MSKTPALLIVLLLLSTLLIFSCTYGGVPSLPFSLSQFINRSTDANYSLFKSGDYNGKIPYVDWNILSFRDVNQVVEIRTPLDTNTVTAGFTNNEGHWIQSFLLYKSGTHVDDGVNIFQAWGSGIFNDVDGSDYCSGDTDTCQNRFATQVDCESSSSHGGACFWDTSGSYCFNQYSSDPACYGSTTYEATCDSYGNDPVCGSDMFCLYDGSTQCDALATIFGCGYYNGDGTGSCLAVGCTEDYSTFYTDETSCNGSPSGYMAWNNADYCNGTLVCLAQGEVGCGDSGGLCLWDTNLVPSTVTSGNFVSTKTSGASLTCNSPDTMTGCQADGVDGYSIENLVTTTTTGINIPTLESGKYLTNNGSALNWDTPITGSKSAPGGVSFPNGTKLFPSFTGETSISAHNDPNNGGANIIAGDLFGYHVFGEKLYNGNIGGIGMASTGTAVMGLFDSAGSFLTGITFNTDHLLTNSPFITTILGSFTTNSPAWFRRDTKANILKTGLLQSPTAVGDVNSLGAEKISNGTFTGNANNWTVGSFAYTSNRINKTADGTSPLFQPIANMVSGFEVGKTYKLSFNSLITVGTVVVSACGNTISTLSPTTSQNVVEDTAFTCLNSTSPLTFTPSNTSRLTNIDNISVKEITDGNLFVVGNLNVGGNIFGKDIYCSFKGDNIDRTVMITSTTDYNQIDGNLSLTYQNGCLFQNAKEFKMRYAGTYTVNWNISSSTSGANDQIEGEVMINGVADQNGGSGHCTTQNSNRPCNVSSSGTLFIDVNDLVSLSVRNISNTNNVVVNHANLTIERKGS